MGLDSFGYQGYARKVLVSLYMGFIIVVEDFVALNHIQQQLEDICVYWIVFGSGQFLL